MRTDRCVRINIVGRRALTHISTYLLMTFRMIPKVIYLSQAPLGSFRWQLWSVYLSSNVDIIHTTFTSICQISESTKLTLSMRSMYEYSFHFLYCTEYNLQQTRPINNGNDIIDAMISRRSDPPTCSTGTINSTPYYVCNM